MNIIKPLRIILIALAIALVLIPSIVVSLTGNGLGEIISHTLISLSILSAIAAIMLGADKKDKNKFFFKVGASVGLLIVLVSIWL